MLHSPRLTQLALTIALVVGAPLAVAAEPAKPTTAKPAAVPATEVTAKAPLPLDELRTFAEVMDRIKAAY
ncbi:MAG: peptidase S41, partial [Pseudomonas sp.]|nr:peptidase S41 [Pseudomonas sp.]